MLYLDTYYNHRRHSRDNPLEQAGAERFLAPLEPEGRQRIPLGEMRQAENEHEGNPKNPEAHKAIQWKREGSLKPRDEKALHQWRAERDQHA